MSALFSQAIKAASMFIGAAPYAIYQLCATSGGREAVNGLALSALKAYAHKIPADGLEFAVKTINGSGLLIDIHWVAVLTSMFFSRPHDFYRNGDSVYKLKYNSTTGQYDQQDLPPEEWRVAEPITLANVEEHKYVLHAEERVMNGIPVKAGLTTFQYLQQCSPLTAFTISLFWVASVHSVLSTVVPCVKDMNAFRASVANKLGLTRIFLPEKCDAMLSKGWDRVGSFSLSTAYICSAYEAGKAWYGLKNKLSLSSFITAGQFVSNATLGAFHTISLVGGKEINRLYVIGKVVVVATLLLEELNKYWNKNLLEAGGRTLSAIRPLTKQGTYL